MEEVSTAEALSRLAESGLVLLGKGAAIDGDVRLLWPDGAAEARPIVFGDGCHVRPGAIVHGGAEIGPGCQVGYRAIVGADARLGAECALGDGVHLGAGVVLGRANTVRDYALIVGATVMGDSNVIGPYTVIGTDPQHPSRLKSAGSIRIGSHNEIREYCTVHLPMETRTEIGDHCYLMAYNHIPHDATVEDWVIMANNCQIGGFTHVMHHANLGLSSVIHQNSTVGAGVMLGMDSVVARDIPPFLIFVNGMATKVNRIGLERMGRTSEQIEALRHWYASGYHSSREDLSEGDSDREWWKEDVAAFFRRTRRPACKVAVE